MENEIIHGTLSSRESKVVEFYQSHRNVTRNECCKSVYGSDGPFDMRNLSVIETSIRKKGFLFYTAKGIVVDMTDETIDPDLRMKVQHKIGSNMVGYLKSNVRLMLATVNEKQLELAKQQFKESVMVLADNGFINLHGLGKLLLTQEVKQIAQ